MSNTDSNIQLKTEELDQMYDSGKSTAGKEFDLFMKLKDVSFAAGSSSSKFIQQEYENHKAQSFFSEIVVQMRNMTTEKSKVEIIESKYPNPKV